MQLLFCKSSVEDGDFTQRIFLYTQSSGTYSEAERTAMSAIDRFREMAMLNWQAKCLDTEVVKLVYRHIPEAHKQQKKCLTHAATSH